MFSWQNSKDWGDFMTTLFSVAARAALGLFKMPKLVHYRSAIADEGHARLALRVFGKGRDRRGSSPRVPRGPFLIDYLFSANSSAVFTQLESICAMDPLTAELILIEASYMEQGEQGKNFTGLIHQGSMTGITAANAKEGSKADRVRDVEALLVTGVAADKLASATVRDRVLRTPYCKIPTKVRGSDGVEVVKERRWLGGDLEHIKSKIFASLGQGDEDMKARGLQQVEILLWARQRGAGAPGLDLPLDEHPRARSAQVRFRELLWFMQDPHARHGVIKGEDQYVGPTQGSSLGQRRLGETFPQTDDGIRYEPDAALSPPHGGKLLSPTRGSAASPPPTCRPAPAATVPPYQPAAAQWPPHDRGYARPPAVSHAPPLSSGVTGLRSVLVEWSDGKQYRGQATSPAGDGHCTVYLEDGSRCDDVPRSRCTLCS